MARPTDAEAAGQSEDDVHEGRAEVPTGSLRLLSWRTSPRMMMMKPSGKFWVKDSQTRCSMITWQNAFGRSSTWPRRMVREWTSKVTETFAKCRRKVKVQFSFGSSGMDLPSPIWTFGGSTSHCDSQNARRSEAIGSVISSMRSYFPDFRASARASSLEGRPLL